jgi:putative DNA primase/helicase
MNANSQNLPNNSEADERTSHSSGDHTHTTRGHLRTKKRKANAITLDETTAVASSRSLEASHIGDESRSDDDYQLFEPDRAPGRESSVVALTDSRLPAILELADQRQWICRREKVPVSITGKPISVVDASNWADFESVNAASAHLGLSGVGFVLSEADPYTCVDIDKCCDASTGQIDEAAQLIIEQLDSYSEYSPSGRGVHIWLRGDVGDLSGSRFRMGDLEVEVYSSKRYMTVTGNHIGGTPTGIHDTAEALIRLLGAYVQQSLSDEAPRHDMASPSSVDLVDDEVILTHLKLNADHAALIEGNFSSYPSQSEAVHALIGAIARFTRDRSQIDRLFRQTKLYSGKWKEEKWERLKEKEITAILSTQHYELTELGNADRFVGEWINDLRYCPEKKLWLRWDGKRWKETANEHMELAKQTARRIMGEAKACKDEKFREVYLSFAKLAQRKNMIAATVDLARYDRRLIVHADQLDNYERCKNLLNCENGTIDLLTGELRPNSRQDFITKLCPVIYDRGATCPTWKTFLDTTFAGVPEIIPFMQRTFGYTLTGSTSERCVFILYGTGANGKSTYLETKRSVMGSDYAQRAPTALLMTQRNEGGASPALARPQGVRFALASETDEGGKLNLARVKDITSTEKITARYLYQNFIEFTAEAKLFLATNHKPDVSSHDQAIWDRIVLIPFDNRVPPDKQDRTLIDRLRMEAPGILAWAVEGLKEYRRIGLQRPSSVEAATNAYRSEMDTIGAFVKACCELEKDVENTNLQDDSGLPPPPEDPRPFEVKALELYRAYEDFCKQEGHAPESNRIFGISMQQDFGFQKTRHASGQRYSGVRLLGSVEARLRE